MTQNTRAINGAPPWLFLAFLHKSALLRCSVTPGSGDTATATRTSDVTTAGAPAPSETVGSRPAPLPMTADTKARTDGMQRPKSKVYVVNVLSLTIGGGKRDPRLSRTGSDQDATSLPFYTVVCKIKSNQALFVKCLGEHGIPRQDTTKTWHVAKTSRCPWSKLPANSTKEVEVDNQRQ